MSQDRFDRTLRDRINAIESDVSASIWDGIAAKKFDQQFRDRLIPIESQVPQDMWQTIAAKQFDQVISSKLRHFESIVPASAWPAIERKLAEKKDRTPILLLFLFFLLAVGAGVWHVWQNHSIPLQSEFDTTVSIEDEATSKSIEEVETSEIVTSQAPGESSIQQHLAAGGIGTQPPIKNTTAFATSSRNESGQKKALLPVVAEGEVPNTLDQTNLKSKIAESDNLSDLVNHSEEAQIDLSEEPGRFAPLIDPLDLLDLSGVSPLEKPRVECPTLKVARSLQPFFELTISPGFPMRSLEDSADNDTYLETRRGTERPTASIAIDALFGLEVKDFEIKTGVSFSQIHEVFDYIDQTSTRTVIDTVFDPNTGEVVDISIVREYGTRIRKTNNRYTFVDIPLIVGYRFSPRKDHSLWLRAGGYLNLLFSQQGTILSASDDLIDLKEESATIFSKKAGFEATASIGYELAMGDKSSLGLQISYRHPFSQLTLDSYPIRQKYQRIQMGFSWKYKF